MVSINGQNKGRHKFDIKWEEGVWLGHARDTNEMLIGTPYECCEDVCMQKKARTGPMER